MEVIPALEIFGVSVFAKEIKSLNSRAAPRTVPPPYIVAPTIATAFSFSVSVREVVVAGILVPSLRIISPGW